MQPADLPHDWLIYDTKNLYEDSIGWYRKKFVYSASGVKRAGEAAQENLREQSNSVAGNACATCDERVFALRGCLHGFFHLYKRRVPR